MASGWDTVSRSMPESFVRLCLTTAVTGVSTAVLGWLIVLDSHERGYMTDRVKMLLHRLGIYVVA